MLIDRVWHGISLYFRGLCVGKEVDGIEERFRIEKDAMRVRVYGYICVFVSFAHVNVHALCISLCV